MGKGHFTYLYVFSSTQQRLVRGAQHKPAFFGKHKQDMAPCQMPSLFSETCKIDRKDVQSQTDRFFPIGSTQG